MLQPRQPYEAVKLVVKTIDDWIGNDLCGMCAIKAAAAQFQLDVLKVEDLYIREKMKAWS